MKSRAFDSEGDYEAVSEWWMSWGWPILPLEFLSTRGIVISNNGVDVCAGWLYSTDSAVCWAENYIANKDVSRELRKGSVEFLIDELTVLARQEGFKLMMSSVKHPGLIKKLIASGFSDKYEAGMSNLTRIL